MSRAGIKMTGFKDFARQIKRIGQYLEPNARYINKLAIQAQAMVQSRTKKSKDIDGRAPKPKKDGTARTLYKSGALLSAIIFKRQGRVITVYVDNYKNRALIAEVHHYGMRSGQGKGFKMPQYKFFGLTKSQEVELGRMQAEIFEELFRKIN